MARTFEFVLHFVGCVTVTVSPNRIIIIIVERLLRDGVSLKTPRPRGWVRAGRPSGGESSFNKRNMYQYPHVSQLFILTSVAKPGIPGAIKNGWVCTADYRMLLGTAVRPVPARMPYISRLCDVGATDVKRWWWWWWWLLSPKWCKIERSC